MAHRWIYRFAALAALASGRSPLVAQDSVRVLDDFSSLEGWTTAPSDGVTLKASLDKGVSGRALRLDVDFRGGGGYAVVRKRLDLDLPPNYEFRWQMRGTVPRNNLEFKLVDSSGENVWWSNQRDFDFARTWRAVSRKRRHIEFAWGPKGGGDITHVRDLEIAITAGSGGKGTVWLDELTLRALPPPDATPPTPVATASREGEGYEADRAVDGDTLTGWRGLGPATLTLDLGGLREFGGLDIRWEDERIPFAVDVETSSDSSRWTTVRRVRGNTRGRTFVPLPEHEARYVRLNVLSTASGVREVTVRPVGWAARPNDFLELVARRAPRGWYPRAWLGEQSYWTVLGVEGDRREGLLSADGALEAGKGSFTLEPFVVIDSAVYGWGEVTAEPWLEAGALPMPGVTWRHPLFMLRIATFAAGRAGSSRLHASYRLTSLADTTKRVTLVLAARPLQANPPWQFLQVTGGFAPIRSADVAGSVVRLNRDRVVAATPPPTRAMALPFDAGDVVAVAKGRVPTGATRATDEQGLASALIAWDATLSTAESKEVAIEVPLYEQSPSRPYSRAVSSLSALERLRTVTAARWDSTLSRTTVSLPDTMNGRRIAETLRASLAYILVNRDSVAIQPGSRSYERSWIRDGALTSAALLRLGQFATVRDYITWFARFQYANGKIPCCVDQRGADPVPEHDSNGEFIYLVAEYLRQSGDTATVRRLWPNVRRAVTYLDSLRRERLTPTYEQPDSVHLRGLLPPSISHEGYSAKPMHSYWDDFFALRGFADAAMLARTVGDTSATTLSEWHVDFQRDLEASIAATMRRHRIDFVPGAADLGDFDPTSTTIALAPVDAPDVVPEGALLRTFDRYWRESEQRRRGERAWENYTPYELRSVGALIRLGRPERALSMLDFFLGDQRPPEWLAWAEVVWRDAKTPKFVGDIPHTWVASDFIRSALDLFAWERSRDSSLVIGAGVVRPWLREDGVRVSRLRTHYGALDLTMREGEYGAEVTWSVTRTPPGGIDLRPPVGWRFAGARGGDGQEVTIAGDGGIRVSEREGRLTARLEPARGR